MTDQAKPRTWTLPLEKLELHDLEGTLRRDVGVKVIEHSAYLRLEKERDEYRRQLEDGEWKVEADLQKRLVDAKAEIDRLQQYNDAAQLTEQVRMLEDCLTKGGYNSVRETLALMSEGEGSDPEVYSKMAKHALNIIDEALARLKEARGE